MKLVDMQRSVTEAGIGDVAHTAAADLKLAEARLVVGLRFNTSVAGLVKHLGSAVTMLMVPGAELPTLEGVTFEHDCVTASDLAACGGSLLHAAVLHATGVALVDSSSAFVLCSFRHVAIALVILASFDVAEIAANARGEDPAHLARPAWLASVPEDMVSDVSKAMRLLTASLFESAPRAVLPRQWVSMPGSTPATSSWLRAETSTENAWGACPRATASKNAVRSLTETYSIVRSLGGRNVYLAHVKQEQAEGVAAGLRTVLLRRWPDPKRAAQYGFMSAPDAELKVLHTVHRKAAGRSHHAGTAKRSPYVARVWCVCVCVCALPCATNVLWSVTRWFTKRFNCVVCTRVGSSFIEFPLEVVAGEGLLRPPNETVAPVLDASGNTIVGAADSCYVVTPVAPHAIGSLLSFKRAHPKEYPELLSDSMKRRMSWELLKAVSQLHEQNIVHRSITSHHVMVSDTGVVELSSMSSAQVNDPRKTAKRLGMIRGKGRGKDKAIRRAFLGPRPQPMFVAGKACAVACVYVCMCVCVCVCVVRRCCVFLWCVWSVAMHSRLRCDLVCPLLFCSTKDGVAAATLPFMAPEHLLGCRWHSQASDMWSVGMVLAHLHLGRVFLAGKDRFHHLGYIFKVCGSPHVVYVWSAVSAVVPVVVVAGEGCGAVLSSRSCLVSPLPCQMACRHQVSCDKASPR